MYYYLSVLLPLLRFFLLPSFFDIMATIQDPEKDFAGKGSVPSNVTPDSPQLSSATGSDLDDNYAVYKQYEGEAPADPAEAKAVLRKIDYRVIGCLFVLYFLQYLDKNGLNYVCILLFESC